MEIAINDFVREQLSAGVSACVRATSEQVAIRRTSKL